MEDLLLLESRGFHNPAAREFVNSLAEWLETQEPTDTFVWARDKEDKLIAFKIRGTSAQDLSYPILKIVQ